MNMKVDTSGGSRVWCRTAQAKKRRHAADESAAVMFMRVLVKLSELKRLGSCEDAPVLKSAGVGRTPPFTEDGAIALNCGAGVYC